MIDAARFATFATWSAAAVLFTERAFGAEHVLALGIPRAEGDDLLLERAAIFSDTAPEPGDTMMLRTGSMWLEHRILTVEPALFADSSGGAEEGYEVVFAPEIDERAIRVDAPERVQ